MKSMWYNGVRAVEPEARVWDEGEKTAGRECGTHVIVWLVRTMSLYLTNVDIYATEGDKVSSQNRRSRQLLPVEDIRVRHVLLLHIHLIVFFLFGTTYLIRKLTIFGGRKSYDISSSFTRSWDVSSYKWLYHFILLNYSLDLFLGSVLI